MCCGEPADPDARLTLHEVLGFTQRRDQGGANHVAFRRETGRMLCAHCSQRYHSTGNPAQVDLFSAGVAGAAKPPPLRDWDWLT